MEFVYLFLTDRIAVASPFGFLAIGLMRIVCTLYTACVCVSTRTCIEKKRRARLSLDVCDGGHQTPWNELRIREITPSSLSHQLTARSYILSNLSSWLPPFENESTTTTKSKTTGSIRFFFRVYNNQSLFGMPLSRFCNNQVPKIRNLFLESNIHFHH